MIKYYFIIHYNYTGESFRNYHNYNSIGQAISMAKSVIHNDIAKSKYPSSGGIKITVFNANNNSMVYKESFNRAKEV